MKIKLVKLTAIVLATLFLSTQAFAWGGSKKDQDINKSDRDKSTMSNQSTSSSDQDLNKDQDSYDSSKSMDQSKTTDPADAEDAD